VEINASLLFPLLSSEGCISVDQEVAYEEERLAFRVAVPAVFLARAGVPWVIDVAWWVGIRGSGTPGFDPL
jgi:hypothetical protein